MTRTTRTDCEGSYRRDFLKFGAAGLVGLGLPEMLRLEAHSAKTEQGKARKASAVILVWLGRSERSRFPAPCC